MKIKFISVYGFEAAIRGMRNPMNSWDKSDSYLLGPAGDFYIGENDMKLAQKLVLAGPEHAKFLRMIHVSADVIAPRMWFCEFDTYKFVEKNSSSTIHRLLNNDNCITLDQFDYDFKDEDIMIDIVVRLEEFRLTYKSLQNNSEVVDKQQKLDSLLRRAKLILPEGYLQLRTIDTNYAELRNIYKQRHDHRLKDWHEFCSWIDSLPYAAQLIRGEDA